MTKFYIFLAAVLVTAGTVEGRSINLQTTMKAPIVGQQVTIGTPFAYKVEFKNLGPDAIAPTDTILYTFTGAGTTVYYRTNMTKAVGDTSYLSTMLTISSASATSIRFCTYSAITGPTITDPNRGNDSSCAQITIKSSGVGISTVITMGSEPASEHLTVFPNPANASIALDYTSRSNAVVTARVYDLTGRDVMTYNFGAAYPGKQGFNLDVSNLQSGLYFVELRQDGVRAVGKMNKQ